MTPARFWTQMAAAVLVSVATALLVLLAGVYGTPDWRWPL